MKKNYKNFKNFALAIGLVLLNGYVIAQATTTTFSVSTSVANTNTGTIQTWTVPPCVTSITMDVRGAQGGNQNSGTGGNGARMQGVVTVTPGQVLSILVGMCPGVTNIFPGGGGGSYVAAGGTYSTATPLMVAGGGGGGYSGYAGTGGVTTTSGTGPNPGTGGNGAPANSCGSGGGGFYTSGGNSTLYAFIGGQGFQQGGQGGMPNTSYATSYQNGGFGGGGAADYVGSCYYYGGSGGGYSGGSAYSTSTQYFGNAGGSFNAGSSQTNTAAYNTGHGIVIFLYTPGSPVIAAQTASAICSGSSVVLSASNVSTYTWSTNSNASSVTVTPVSTTNYTVSGTNSSGCVTSSVLTVTVNSGVPVLSVNSSTNSTCLGKSVTLTATGAITYSWTNGVTNGVAYVPSGTNTYTVSGTNGCGTSTAITTVSIAPLAISIVANPTAVCAGSTSTITAAAAATSYSWYPISNNSSVFIASPNANTIYTVAVTDGTCSGNGTVAVTAKPVPTISATPSLITVCSGIPVTFTASGGTSYTWVLTSNNSTVGTGAVLSVTPNAPTGYQVIGSNTLGCTASAPVVVITNASPVVNLNANSVFICSGDQVTLSVSGASTYVWDSGALTTSIIVTPTITTTYSVTGTANGCSSTSYSTITVFIPTVAISGNTSVCLGQSSTLTATGASQYTWNNVLSPNGVTVVVPTSNTTYSLATLSTSNGINCPLNDTYQVTVKALPTLIATAQRTAMCKSESNTITISGAASYSWNNGGSSSVLVITPTLITTNNYIITGTNTAGCSNTTSISVKVNACTGISEIENSKSLVQIYPNPNNGNFEISASTEMNLSIYNEIGQVVKSLKLSDSNGFKVSVQNLSSGIYFIVSENKNVPYSQKIIIQ